MLKALDTQIILSDEGVLHYQKNPTNPLPGVAVAKIKKGETPLKPALDLLDEALLVSGEQDRAVVEAFLVGALTRHIATVLEPLVGLAQVEGLAAPVIAICAKLHEAMGILPRGALEGDISGLDAEMRQSLRAKKIRLGPVLAFIPALNKPAAVRLRGLLWALSHDKPLPAGVPADGIVSLKIDPEAIDPNFYRSIGYPVYGPRAIRIDMLDRVISAVYDCAKEGKFQARHDMAEWLGCSIDDLYAILEAMGHKKIEEAPLVVVPKVEEGAENKESEAKAEEVKEELPKAESPESADKDENKGTPSAKPVEAPKPILATFRLKKGKAAARAYSSQDKERHNNRNDFKSKPKSDERSSEKKYKGKRNKQTNRTVKIMHADAPKSSADDSPFAILAQLKAKKDGS